MSTEDSRWIEVEVTIETTTEEKALHKVDRSDFERWAGTVSPYDLAAKVKEYLQAGDSWDVCAEVYAAARGPGEVVDCEIIRASVPEQKP